MCLPGLELSLILFIGGICSYLSFWRPDLLSPNISSTNSRLKKWVEALFSLSVITALYLLSPPEQLLDWVNYGVFVWLLYIAIIDAQTKIIPNRVVLLGLLSWLLLIPINFELNQILSAIGVLVGSVLINYVSDYLFRQKGFGWGDVKLFVVLALFMGTQVFAILYIAILLGGLYGIALKLSSKYNKNEHLAFSPFIIIAYMLVRTLTI